MSDDDEKVEKKSAATVLVELALDRYSFGISSDGEPFAVPLMGDPVARLLRGGKRGLRSEMARTYYQKLGKAAPQQALADALLVIEGIAGEAEPEPLAQRVAQTSESWWIDLGDIGGDAIRITGAGWKVMTPAIKFRRTILTAALPAPVRGGSLDELWALLNVSTIDRPLVLAWLIAAMVADIPHPILNLSGEQGTAKSTGAKIITSLIDPSPVPLRKAPRDAESWVTAAAGSWVVAIDNVSTIPDWLSDTFCRAVTGDGDVRRQLYTDGGLALFAFRRALLLNGIDLGAVRGDLADRLLVIDLDVIAERDRRLDADVERTWQLAHPRILGALLDLAASVASVLPGVTLTSMPRMADFARILAAVDQVLGTKGLERYATRAGSLAADALTGDEFVMAMRSQLEEPFIGTAAQLLTAIDHGDGGRAPKGWPATARSVTTLLKRQAPVMRRAGWTVAELPAGHDNAIKWKIARPEFARKEHSQRSQTRGKDPDDVPECELASVASDEYRGTQEDSSMTASVSRPLHPVPSQPAKPPGNPCCTQCGKANLFAPTSIASGICASCAKAAPATESRSA